MKKSLVILSMLLCVTVCAAQDKGKSDGATRPDLSGTWELDKSKSQLGRFGQGQMANAVVTLTINHKEPELKITRKVSVGEQQQSQESSYFNDGRGEANPSMFTNTNIKTKTKWEGAKLTSKGTITIIPRSTSEPVFIDVVEKREVSSDGKTLVINTFISNPAGNEVIKQVFNRAS